MTASVGAATALPPWEREAVITAADEATYAAKVRGRNRVEFAGSGAGDAAPPAATARRILPSPGGHGSKAGLGARSGYRLGPAMAKKSKTAKAGSKPRERQERRFEPSAGARPELVYVLGAVGALAMGAGSWETLGPLLQDDGPLPLKAGRYLLAAGALVASAAVWIGTSGEPALRVGDGGVATEKGGLRRLPWFAVERVELSDGAVHAVGTDDGGSKLVISASLSAQPQAAAWLVREARARVPSVVLLPEEGGATVPEASAAAGEVLALEPPQVVGKHCVASGKVIAYEPDARVCPRCERVYHKASVPEECACGGSMAGA